VIWDNELSKRIVTAHNDMTPVLPPAIEAGLFQRFDTVVTGNSWQFAHTAITKVSKRSSGTGSPSSSRAET
jgi:hypothetical protein